MEEKVDRISSGENGEIEKNNGENEKVEGKWRNGENRSKLAIFEWRKKLEKKYYKSEEFFYV